MLFRSAGGSDDLANLTTLCAAHHQRCVYGGVIRISGRAPEGLVFEMPLGRFRSGDSRAPCADYEAAGATCGPRSSLPGSAPVGSPSSNVTSPRLIV